MTDEQKQVARKLLTEWVLARSSVIWEYSGDITQELHDLADVARERARTFEVEDWELPDSLL
jgi:hypothetical protein